jgi:predicted HTH transcriptional regulator
MERRSSVGKKAMKFVFYAAAAAVGTILAVSAAKKKGKLIKDHGKKVLGNARRAIKSYSDKLSDRQKSILRLFDREDKITNEMICNTITDVTERTLRRDLEFLEQKKYIKKIGKTKGSYYVLG